MFGSGPQAAAPQELAVLHAAGVGIVPHHTQVTPLTAVQLTKFKALSSVVQSAVVHERLTCVKPVSVAAVPQFGKMLALRVLVLTILTVVVSDSLATST